MVPAELVIAVLDWNGEALTRACVASLGRLEGVRVKTLIVDNGSSDPEVDRQLAAEFGVECLRLDRNLGVGGGYNAALRWACDRGIDHVLLLNNDTLVGDPQLARRLLDACGPNVLAVGPLVLDGDDSLFSAGGMLDWRSAQTGHIRRQQMPATDACYPVPWVDGSCLLVSVRVACHVGGFDEEFFLYWEEVDLCVRATRRGFRCLVEPRASIVHLGSQSARPSQIDHLMLRNVILFMRRNATGADLLRFLLHLGLLRIPRFVARRTRHGAPVQESFGMVIRAVSWNVRDVWRKRTLRPVPDGSLHCVAPIVGAGAMQYRSGPERGKQAEGDVAR
jgi:GT2 family glycosyltransferase